MRVHSHCQAMAARICAVRLLTSALMVTHATVLSGEQDIPSIDFNSSQLYFPYNTLSLFYTCLCGDVEICTLFYEDFSVVRVCQSRPLTRSTATKTKTFLCDVPNDASGQKEKRFWCSTQPPGQGEFQCSDLSSTPVSHINGRHTSECTDKCVTILWNRCPFTYKNFDNDTLPLKGSCSRPTNSTNTAAILGESAEPMPSFSQSTASDNAIGSAEICSVINYTGDNATGSTQSSAVMENTGDNAIGSTQSFPVMENTGDNAIGSTQSSPVMENTGDNAIGSTQSSPVMENTGDNAIGSTQSSAVMENTGDNSSVVILAVGIAVGVCIILALSALTVFCLWRRRRSKTQDSNHLNQHQHYQQQQQPVEEAPGATNNQPVTYERVIDYNITVPPSNTPAHPYASIFFSGDGGEDTMSSYNYLEPVITITPTGANSSPYVHYHTIDDGEDETGVNTPQENQEVGNTRDGHDCSGYVDIDLCHGTETVSAPVADNHVIQSNVGVLHQRDATDTYAEYEEIADAIPH